MNVIKVHCIMYELLNRNILEKLNLFVSWTINFKIKIYTFTKYVQSL